MNRTPDPEPTSQARKGIGFGLGAYGLWGLLPVYFKAIDEVPPVDIVGHRIFWSLPFLALLLSFGSGWKQIRQAASNPRLIGILAFSACLVAVNWLIYVYAVVSGHILAGSLGYYLNPLMNVLLGRIVLGERLVPLQWAAVVIAAVGVAALAVGALGHLWISLTLAVSFATYGLVRKMAPVDSIAGLSIETALLFPFAAAWLAWGLATGDTVFGADGRLTLLLVAAGVISTIPLLFFTAAARRLRYSTLGMLQFIAPTLQFFIAVFLYGEAVTTAHAIAFGAIWLALALYVYALAGQARASAKAARAPVMRPE